MGYKDYSEVKNFFGSDHIKERFQYLYDKMDEYLKERDFQNVAVINESSLQNAIVDYFTDIYRLKKFHDIKNVNDTKRVSYTVYWLLKRKPIQVTVSTSDNDDGRMAFLNEGFLTMMIAHELLIPDEMERLGGAKKEAFSKFIKHINYHLKYRNVDKQTIELMFLAYDVGRVLGEDKNALRNIKQINIVSE